MSSTCESRYFLAECHRASRLGGLCDTMASSRAREGARRLRAATSPSPAHEDDSVSSSTALAGLADRWSSSIGERQFFLLGVVTCCREAADRLPGHPSLVQSPGERTTVPLCDPLWRAVRDHRFHVAVHGGLRGGLRLAGSQDDMYQNGIEWEKCWPGGSIP